MRARVGAQFLTILAGVGYGYKNLSKKQPKELP